MNADRDILANVVAMCRHLGQLQLVNSLVLSKCCRVLRKRRSEHPNSCPTTGIYGQSTILSGARCAINF